MIARILIDSGQSDHAYAQRLRALNRMRNATYATFRKGIEHPDAAISVNVIIGVIRVASHLLARRLQQLERAFLEQGGLRERMTRARLEARRREA